MRPFASIVRLGLRLVQTKSSSSSRPTPCGWGNRSGLGIGSFDTVRSLRLGIAGGKLCNVAVMVGLHLVQEAQNCVADHLQLALHLDAVLARTWAAHTCTAGGRPRRLSPLPGAKMATDQCRCDRASGPPKSGRNLPKTIGFQLTARSFFATPGGKLARTRHMSRNNY